MDLDLAEKHCQSLPWLFGCPLPRTFIEAAIVKDATNEMAVETFAKKNVEWVAPDVVAADVG